MVKSSFDKHVEVYWTESWKSFVQCPKWPSKHFYSQKKTYFLRKGSSGRGKCFWQNRKVSRSMSKIMSKTFFFQKKIFLVEKFLWTRTMQFRPPRQKTSTKGQKTSAKCPKTTRNSIKFWILGSVYHWTVPMDR